EADERRADGGEVPPARCQVAGAAGGAGTGAPRAQSRNRAGRDRARAHPARLQGVSMPHLVIQHTPNIPTDWNLLCHSLLDTLLSIRDDKGQQAFPEGGTRVMTFPAAACAVGDGKGSYGYMYANLRIFEGRGPAVVKDTGDKLMAVLR